ncbi:hypothetical protein BS47DRAFT_1334154 [Hydnum rufescens UP504]|uniref:Tethering factor for nuclear proteasome STS1 n=1 Tax=Hydnum rufescens UP504 TaxID=1448309 RepID=A0A9P6AHB7_9AGAM|nr:hypothetical protein BS47DRAFT_1334154 [Hydnum rufescens UP504]
MDVLRSPLPQRTIPFPSIPPGPQLGWGFGVSSPYHATAGPLPLKPVIPPTPSRQSASNKRRHEQDPDQQDDNMMTRSPSPDRPKKTISKRMRVEPPKSTPTSAAGKQPGDPQDSIDVGVLLASLPPGSHLPILTSLITKHPGIKSLLIPLMPRPTLDSALHALNASIRKIREAYPYSQPSSVSAGYGFGGAPSRPASLGGIGGSHPSKGTSGMRDTYIQGRLRPVVAEFASTARSYLVYFTSVPGNAAQGSSSPVSASSSTSLPPALSHPSETFTYLHAVTVHYQRLPPLARNLLSSESTTILVRLHKEWQAWLDRLDEHVNRSGGMYGSEAVRTWERGLEEMVVLEDKDVKEGVSVDFGPESGLGPRPMRSLRDAWIGRVGWLIGRNRAPEPFSMDEDEEL